jgi:spore germination protein YaaH
MRRLAPVLIALIVMLAGLSALAAFGLAPSRKTAAYPRSAAVRPESADAVFNFKTYAGAAAYINGECYLSVDIIKECIDEYVLWDEKANVVIITTRDRVVRMNGDELTYYINSKPQNLSFPVAVLDSAMLPAGFVEEFYGFSASYRPACGLAAVRDLSAEMKIASVSAKEAAFRSAPDKKAPIYERLPKGTSAEVFGEAGENGEYIAAMLSDGRLGYISAKKLSAYETKKPSRRAEPPAPPAPEGRITMMWDQFFSAEAAANPQTRYLGGYVSVVSPTWFSFDESLSGALVNIADKSYVDWAHGANALVWALITDNFDGDVTRFIIGDSEKRDGVIRQMLSFAAIYGFDGINVDFEMVRQEDAGHFIQFLRELCPLAREQGLTVSVDMYVPKPYNLYYNRAEVAKTADYVIIMGYDEFYAGGGKAGPVASIGFVEEGITETLKEVPKERVILGVPLYNRIWAEAEDGGVTSEACGMARAREMFEAAGAELVWDEETATTYGEFSGKDENGVPFVKRVWIEDERALDEKLKLADMYGLAGVAGWKRRMETENVWAMFEKWRTHGANE